MGCVDQVADSERIAPLHRALTRSAGRCTGVDVNEDGILALRAEGYDVVVADVTSPRLRGVVDGPYDVVIAGEILEHLLDVAGLMDNAHALLRPGGVLVVTIPNPGMAAAAIPALFGWYAGNVDHVADYNPYEMFEIADRTGFRVARWFGELAELRGKRSVLTAGGRLVRWLWPESTADCSSLVYILEH